jgi:hypothetical protein
MENKLFPVTVDFSLSLAEMIRAGNYFYVNFTPSETSQPQQESKATQEVNIEFVEFNQNSEMQTMLDKFDNDGLRPASLPEFLALGANTCAKSSWNADGFRTGHGRGLDTDTVG